MSRENSPRQHERSGHDEQTALTRLAERCGIEPEFVDAQGEQRRTSAETQRALLAALGIPAADDAEAARSLARLTEAEWSRPLPEVCVTRAAPQAPAVELVLPAGHAEVRWTLQLEGGETRRGRAVFSELELRGSETVGGRLFERRSMELPADTPTGYHRLQLEGEAGSTTLVVSPGRCWVPPQIAGGSRVWGVAIQLYALKSHAQWGIGDYGDLGRFASLVKAEGADVIGLNPLHALFLDSPAQASPYSPLSRLLLNVLNIDVSTIPELHQCQRARALTESPAFGEALERSREAGQVDYEAVAALKRPVLAALFACFRESAADERRQAFKRFRGSQTQSFERACVFQALREHLSRADPRMRDCRQWPAEYRDVQSAAVAGFTHEHASDIEELMWLQWIADQQLASAAKACEGMSVGLYKDVAVGADAAGAEAWSNPDGMVSGASVGAPPDLYNPAGQNWGLPPPHPQAMRAQGYRNFIELLRANMRHCGGLRIDHVMALQHLYCIPQGAQATEGAYVRYPLDDLVGILALESQRHRCLIVGEDLGTVPEGFRERMAEAGVFSYRVLFFEQDAQSGELIAPERYPRQALAVVGSHDLPTLLGWWRGQDLEIKGRLNLFPDEAGKQQATDTRERDRKCLLKALRDAALLGREERLDEQRLSRAVHAFLGRSSAALVMAQIDDLTGEVDPVNVPATSDEYPNWRRKLSVPLEALQERSQLRAVAAELRAARGEQGGRSDDAD